jgi:hypothetical protein
MEDIDQPLVAGVLVHELSDGEIHGRLRFVGDRGALPLEIMRLGDGLA